MAKSQPTETAHSRWQRVAMSNWDDTYSASGIYCNNMPWTVRSRGTTHSARRCSTTGRISRQNRKVSLVGNYSVAAYRKRLCIALDDNLLFRSESTFLFEVDIPFFASKGCPMQRCNPYDPSIESNVRSYCRLFPVVFESAVGSTLRDTAGREYLDFFCGAGSLNYGHNNRHVKKALLEYIAKDGIQHSLDTATTAKLRFIETFKTKILDARGYDYRIQFTGPTGTNAVEAAVKLARLQTQRSHVVAFTNGYHGHSLGALALTGNQYYHSEFYGSHNNVTHLPFDGYMGDQDTSTLLEKMLCDRSSGLPVPAAIILETVQGEGGINVASSNWLRRVELICRRFDIRLIVDDIQVGNGRTGRFFSFEESGIIPDMVCISKSIGGGLPMAIVLVKPQFDEWKPGQHTGTFRGNNLAFVAANALINNYWAEASFEESIHAKSNQIAGYAKSIAQRFAHDNVSVRGRGLIWGIDVGCGKIAAAVIRNCFEQRLLLEASGVDDSVLKIMPALTISESQLAAGLSILERAIAETLTAERTPTSVVCEAAAGLPLIQFGSPGAVEC